MTTIRVHTDIAATPEQVWRAVADIGSHVLWMRDAEAIRFTSTRLTGVGTTFECDTRVGPFRLVDQMAITRWRPRRQMGVRHTGVISGRGMFTLRVRTSSPAPHRGRARRRHRSRRTTTVTRFSWKERLHFPWYLGGPLGALAARPILRWTWRRNLAELRRLVEAGAL